MFFKKDKSKYNSECIVKNPNELPGVKKKSFILPFAGGEIWFEHLDGLYGHTELALEKLAADAPVFQRPSSPSFIGFVLDETEVTDEFTEMITDKLLNTHKRFMRVGFIGADSYTKMALKKRLYGHGFALGFFLDFEKAKEWLISEGI